MQTLESTGASCMTANHVSRHCMACCHAGAGLRKGIGCQTYRSMPALSALRCKAGNDLAPSADIAPDCSLQRCGQVFQLAAVWEAMDLFWLESEGCGPQNSSDCLLKEECACCGKGGRTALQAGQDSSRIEAGCRRGPQDAQRAGHHAQVQIYHS